MNPLSTSGHIKTEDLDPEFLKPRAMYWLARLEDLSGLSHHQRDEMKEGLHNLTVAVDRLEAERLK